MNYGPFLRVRAFGPELGPPIPLPIFMPSLGLSYMVTIVHIEDHLWTFGDLYENGIAFMLFAFAFSFPHFGKFLHVIFHSLHSPKLCLVWYEDFLIWEYPCVP